MKGTSVEFGLVAHLLSDRTVMRRQCIALMTKSGAVAASACNASSPPATTFDLAHAKILQPS